jgi:hypothetical protein
MSMNEAQIKKVGSDLVKAIHKNKSDIKEVKQTILSKKDKWKVKVKVIKKNIYPDLKKFKITDKDIKLLRKKKVLDKNQITDKALQYVRKSNDPLLKLLYALCWKNNDELVKLNCLVAGIENANSERDVKKKTGGHVLHQFGRHLANWPRKEPLVDQHSIRAYLALKQLGKIKDKCNISETLEEILKINSAKLKPKWVKSYVAWFKILMRKDNHKFQRKVDELLMLFGQAIRPKSKNKE